MVEWGVVQSKFNKSKFQIEERMVDMEVKYILPKVWVQFTGLLLHLKGYLIIWAVGSILGVTKEVDMVFTRCFDISRMQVMVMDPNLIPHRVNVVIGEGLYELNFRVEEASVDSNAQSMDMDTFLGEGGSRSKDAGNSKQDKQSSVQGGTLGGSGQAVSGGVGDRGSNQEAGHKVATLLLHIQSQVSGMGGDAVPKVAVTSFADGSGIVAGSSDVAEFSSTHNLNIADHKEEDGSPRKGL
jgi:hypothetical protein